VSQLRRPRPLGARRAKARCSILGGEHVRRYRETDGEEGYIWNGVTALLLTKGGHA
jgi:hypothetical protein